MLFVRFGVGFQSFEQCFHFVHVFHRLGFDAVHNGPPLETPCCVIIACYKRLNRGTSAHKQPCEQNETATAILSIFNTSSLHL